MITAAMNRPHNRRKQEKIYLHPLPVRLWHWLNALGFVLLIVTGASTIALLGGRKSLAATISEDREPYFFAAWLLVLAGLAVMVATLLLYWGLARGPVTIVSPIAASYPVFNMALAVLLGLSPSPWQWGAMAAVVAAGAWHVTPTRCPSSVLGTNA